MTFKTILMHVRPTATCDHALRAAVAFAREHQACLIGLGAVASPFLADPVVGYVGTPALELLIEQRRTDLAEAKARFERAAHGLGTNAQWLATEDFPNSAMRAAAAGADILLVALEPGGPDCAIQAADLVLEAGLPMIAMPERSASLSSRSILVAWKNTAEARRAVSSALPLLKRAQSVALVTVAAPSVKEEGWRSLRSVAERLRRHGVETTTECRPCERNVAQTLLWEAQERSSDLMVMGAYGHSRLREWVLGGATRDLLEGTSPPLFLTH